MDRWIVSRLQRAEREVGEALSDYRFDLAAHALYGFVWNEYCDWYVELAKVELQSNDAAVARAARRTLLRVLETVLRLAHPFMPFITEELWQRVAPLAMRYAERNERQAQGADLEQALAESRHSVSTQRWPEPDATRIDEAAEATFDELRSLVDACRALRGEMGIGPQQRVPLLIESNASNHDRLNDLVPFLPGLARLSEVQLVHALPERTIAPVQLVGAHRLMLRIDIDPAAEAARLDKEIMKLQADIERANGKLSNASFVDRAPPAVVQQERDRLAQFEIALEQLRRQRSMVEG